MPGICQLRNDCASARLDYATSLCLGRRILRPYQLAWRADMGLAQMCEPEELETLVQLILSEGLLASCFLMLFSLGRLANISFRLAACLWLRGKYCSTPQVQD